MTITREDVKKAVTKKFVLLNQDTSFSKGAVAGLRRVGFEPVERNPDSWSLLYRDIELPHGIHPAEREKFDTAFLLALIVYASQRRNNPKAYSGAAPTIGQHLAAAQRTRGNLDRKASALFGGTNVYEIARGLQSILLLGNKTTTIDYVDLVWDFYQLQNRNAKSVLTTWGTDYYKKTPTKNSTTTEPAATATTTN